MRMCLHVHRRKGVENMKTAMLMIPHAYALKVADKKGEIMQREMTHACADMCEHMHRRGKSCCRRGVMPAVMLCSLACAQVRRWWRTRRGSSRLCMTHACACMC